MFSLLPVRIFCFPCYVEVSLDFKLEHIKKKQIFFKVFCARWTNGTYCEAQMHYYLMFLPF